MTMGVETLNALLFRLVTPAAALANERVQLNGEANALERFVRVFGFHAGPGMVDLPAVQPVRKSFVGARRADSGATQRRL